VTLININIKKYNWLLDANNLSSQTGKFSHIFDDELNNLVNDHDVGEFNGPMFVRTENVSLKYGQHGTGPYYNLKMIIESLVSCIDTHTPFNLNNNNTYGENIIKLYLFKWNEK